MKKVNQKYILNSFKYIISSWKRGLRAMRNMKDSEENINLFLVQEVIFIDTF